jgi:DNA-binding XRE family transcriptional regulator
MPADHAANPHPDTPVAVASDVVVSPVVVISQTFPARPSSLPDAQDLLRSALAGSTIGPNDLRAINVAITDAMLQAASPSIGSFQVVIRIFPDDAEVEVLSTPDAVAVNGIPAVPGTSFAEWLAEVLRRQGLSQEAAARQLGVSVRTVSRWVRGQTEPRMRDIRRISDVFGPVPHS